MRKHYRMVIKNDSTLTVETIGQTGESCSKNMEQVLVAIGGQTTETKNKPEFYDPENDPQIFISN